MYQSQNTSFIYLSLTLNVSKYEQVVYFEDTKSYLKDYLRKAMKASCQYLLIYQDLMKLDTQPNISLSIKL